MVENKKLISVVIPVYNRTTELHRAIKSVLNQTYIYFEILIVDDGSTSNIEKVCKQFNDKRIKYFRMDKHTNANVARNFGLIEASGTFIAMLDSDDEFLPHHLQRRIDKMKQCNCDGIFGSAYIYNGQERNLKLSRPLKNGEKMINYLLTDGFAQTSSHFYKGNPSRKIMWDEKLFRHQDFDFSVRFAEKYKFISDYEPTIIINWISSGNKNLYIDSCLRFIDKNSKDISPKVFTEYNKVLLSMIENNNIEENVKYSFEIENRSLKNIIYVSFYDFYVAKTKKENKLINKILIYLEYVYKILLYLLQNRSVS